MMIKWRQESADRCTAAWRNPEGAVRSLELVRESGPRGRWTARVDGTATRGRHRSLRAAMDAVDEAAGRCVASYAGRVTAAQRPYVDPVAAGLVVRHA